MDPKEKEVVESLQEKLNNLNKQLENVLHSIETLKSEERAIKLQISTIQQTIAIYSDSLSGQGPGDKQAKTTVSKKDTAPKTGVLALGSKKDYFNTMVIDVLEAADEFINKKEIEQRIVSAHGEARATMLSQYLMQMKNNDMLCAVRLNNSHKKLYYGPIAWQGDQQRLNQLVKRFKRDTGLEVESFEWL